LGAWDERDCSWVVAAGVFVDFPPPEGHALLVEGDCLHVRTSDVHVIGLTGGGDRWQSGMEGEASLEQPSLAVVRARPEAPLRAPGIARYSIDKFSCQ